MEVHSLAGEAGIVMDKIGKILFLNALAACMRNPHHSETPLARRQEIALRLAVQTWKDRGAIKTNVDFCILLGAAWRVCAAIGKDALAWAEELLLWYKSQDFPADMPPYFGLLSLLEQTKQHARVDDMLDELVTAKGFTPDEVLLGNLIDAASTVHEIARVEHFWHLFVNKFKVRPNQLCYNARGKAHLLSARPHKTVTILSEMSSKGMPPTDERTVALLLQALLIICSSQPAASNMNQLKKLLNSLLGVDMGHTRTRLQRQTEQLKDLAQQLLANPSSLSFQDLLVRSDLKTVEAAREFGLATQQPHVVSKKR